MGIRFSECYLYLYLLSCLLATQVPEFILSHRNKKSKAFRKLSLWYSTDKIVSNS